MSFKVLFIYPNFRSESLVPPAIAILSRILKNHGISVELFDTTDYGLGLSRDHDKLSEELLAVLPSPHRTLKKVGCDPWKDLNDQVNRFQPNLIALSTTESTFLLGVEIVQHIERRNPRDMPVILGGNFAMTAPDRALSFPEIDIVCVGEGEKSLLELCQRMEQGKPYKDVRGLWFKGLPGMPRKNPPADPVLMEENPTDFDLGLFDPDRLIRPMSGKNYRMAPVETIRGCVYHCGFCNSADTGSRKKSIRKVFEEITYYRDVHKVEYMYFWADTFLMMSVSELAEFCEMYQDVRLPFWVQTRVETITDWRLKPLKEVGLHKIAFGIENGNEEFRQKVVHKEFTNDEAVRALDIVADLGIIYNTNNIVGYPYETREIAMDTVRLNRRFRGVETVNCFTFTPYHGTRARDEAIAAGFMDKNAIASSDTNEGSILNMPQFTPEEIRKFQRVFPLYVKFPEDRWPAIRQAEEETEEGNDLLALLRAEYKQTYFGEPIFQSH
ncbi:MAG: radical SAM protein [Minisyncoccia bacterium]